MKEKEHMDNKNEPQNINMMNVITLCNDVCNSLLLYKIVSRVLKREEVETILKISRKTCVDSISQYPLNYDNKETFKVIDETHKNIGELIKQCDEE